MRIKYAYIHDIHGCIWDKSPYITIILGKKAHVRDVIIVTVKGKMDINGYPFQDVNRSLSVRTHIKICSTGSTCLRIRSNDSDIHSKLIDTSVRTVRASVRTVFISVRTVLASVRTVLASVRTVLSSVWTVLTSIRTVLASVWTVLSSVRTVVASVHQLECPFEE